MERSPPRHFSMLRDFRIADLFTLLNGLAGTGAILCFMRYCVEGHATFFWLGTALLPVALFMDVLDGRVARARGEASPLGQELDSLADIVSFGVGPAAMAFAVGLRGGWDALCLMYFVACGISRLARYNVTAPALAARAGKVTYFEGLPIPSSLLLVALMAYLAWSGRSEEALPLGALGSGFGTLHPLSLVFVLHGTTMISKTLRIPKP
jgi:CDP-diacylglycerol--serine O-phosphatidyltransferase